MRVLVTGGSGFIGSHVVDRLIVAGLRPRVFDLRPSPHHSPDEVEAFVGDLLDPAMLREAMRGCDAVAHLGAMADADDVARRPSDAERVNSQGTLNVLEAARHSGVRRVIYASTIWVYSDSADNPVDEDSSIRLPAHLYTATKLAGEMYCRSYAELYGLECTILRFGIPYGPRARPEAVIPTFVRKALAGEPLTIAGGGRQSRRFIYVEDLAEGVVRALVARAGNRIYNLVGDEDVTIAEVAEAVRRTVGDTTVVDVPGRGGDFAGARVSGERAARELGWRATTPFVDGVERYAEWHRARADGARPLPAPAPQHRLGRVPIPAALASRVTPSWLLSAVVLMLGGFLELLHKAGSGADDLRTVVITSLLGLTVYAGLVLPARGRELRLAGIALLSTAVLVLMVLRFPHDAARLAHTDVHLLLPSTLGSAFGVGTGMAGRRLLLGRLRGRPSDASG